MYFLTPGKKVFFLNRYMEPENPEGDTISGPTIKKPHEFFVLQLIFYMCLTFKIMIFQYFLFFSTYVNLWDTRKTSKADAKLTIKN